MAIKPVLTVPPWAGAGNYPAGGDPWSAQARRVATNLVSFADAGFTPEGEDDAERWNEYVARIRDFVFWTEEGTTAQDENPHIVEADSDGRIQAALGTFGPHSTDGGPTLTVNAPTTGGEALSVTGDAAGGVAGLFSNGGAGAAVRATQSGSGPAIQGLKTTSDGDGVEGTANGTGAGVLGIGDAAAGHGVRGTGGNSASSIAVFGETTQDAATAIRGKLRATSTAAAFAVQGTGEGAGNGVLASVVNGGTGYSLFVFPDQTAPERAAVHLDTQDTEPITHQQGDFYVNSADDLWWFRDEASFKAMHQSAGGFAFGFEEASGAPHDNTTEQGGATYASAQITNKVTADILVKCELSIGGSSGDPFTVRIRRGSGTGGTIIATRLVTLPVTTANGSSWSGTITALDLAQAPATRNFQLTVQRGAGSSYDTQTNTMTAEIKS